MTAEVANKNGDFIKKGFIKVVFDGCDAIIYYGVNEDGSVNVRGYSGCSLNEKFYRYKNLNVSEKQLSIWHAELSRQISRNRRD